MPDTALRMRPRTIDQVIGQQHLVGVGKIIRRMVEANRPSSMILFGLPGIGKPVLLAIAGTIAVCSTFNATVDSKNASKKSQRKLNFGGLVLALDESRLGKTKQDFLPPLLEAVGHVTIGATTENPFSLSHLLFVAAYRFLSWEPLTNEQVKQALKNGVR